MLGDEFVDHALGELEVARDVEDVEDDRLSWCGRDLLGSLVLGRSPAGVGGPAARGGEGEQQPRQRGPERASARGTGHGGSHLSVGTT
ncbi:hypothetical protein [Streptomyces formicae]|uniref:hypothetical protein n=1 Tax=Streptomyces formicae TaxID=1616117 RepID=UPI001F586F3C|nr:hypothetical protein [Streptomyces formicae]